MSAPLTTSSRKIIDCFIFYNEFDMLTYRLNILNDFVDHFIIVESTHTFAGHEKQLYFNENKKNYDMFAHKIIHIIVDNFPYKFPAINYAKNEQWTNEHFQRNAIAQGINKIDNLNAHDIIIIADVDEIPDPAILTSLKTTNIDININSLEMDFYYYNLNTKFDNKWSLCKILSYKTYNELKQTCDQIRNTERSKIKKGGWHLSYFGDSKFIKNKITHFSHQELNLQSFTDLSKIEERVSAGRDLYDRIPPTKIKICDNSYLPTNYDIYLKDYFTV